MQHKYESNQIMYLSYNNIMSHFVRSSQQEGKDYIPLGSFWNEDTNHGEGFKENPLAVTNLRCVSM